MEQLQRVRVELAQKRKRTLTRHLPPVRMDTQAILREEQVDAYKLNAFRCPILQRVFIDPVIAADNYTYERSAIVQWLSENRTSPMTNLVIHTNTLFANRALLEAMENARDMIAARERNPITSQSPAQSS